MNSDETGYLIAGGIVSLSADASMIRDDGKKEAEGAFLGLHLGRKCRKMVVMLEKPR
jgi:hypothetical protein